MRQKKIIAIIMLSMLISSCGPGQPFGPTLTPLPSDTPLPTETSTPIPTDPPAPTEPPPPTQPDLPPTQVSPAQAVVPITGTLIMLEQFQDNHRGWASLDANAQVEVRDENLFLTSVQVDPPAIAYCTGQDCIPVGDRYYYQVVIAEASLAEQGIGLVFGLDPGTDTYYRFSVRPTDGKFSLRKRVNGAWAVPANWEDSSILAASPGINTLGVAFQGGILDLYINGQRVANRVDTEPLPAGAIGLISEGGGLISSSAALYSMESPSPPTETLRPTNTPGNTPTPSPYAACYPGVPEDHWVLQITLVGTDPVNIVIDGVKYELTELISVFYLTIGDVHTVKIGNKVKEYQMKECKVVYVKAK